MKFIWIHKILASQKFSAHLQCNDSTRVQFGVSCCSLLFLYYSSPVPDMPTLRLLQKRNQ